ncbi:MAG: hypothetical protein WCJ75_10145, partial [Desulfomonile sp.]
KLSFQREDTLGPVFEIIGSHNTNLPENRKILPGRIPPVAKHRTVFHGHGLTNVSLADTTEEQLQKLPPQSQQHPKDLTLNNVNLPAQSLSGYEVYYLVELCLRFQYILLHPGPLAQWISAQTH